MLQQQQQFYVPKFMFVISATLYNKVSFVNIS